MTKLLLGAGSHATAEVAKWEGLHAKAVAAYNAQLWNASAGLYSDWIDTAGATRHETTRHDTTRHDTHLSSSNFLMKDDHLPRQDSK
jgi:hypothetical protein